MSGNEDIYENRVGIVIPHPIPKDQMWIHDEFNKVTLAINNLRKEMFRQDKESKKNKPVLHKVVRCNALHVRVKPGKENNSVDILKPDDIVYVYNEINGWCQIDEKGTRFCSGDYLEPVKIR